MTEHENKKPLDGRGKVQNIGGRPGLLSHYSRETTTPQDLWGVIE